MKAMFKLFVLFVLPVLLVACSKEKKSGPPPVATVPVVVGKAILKDMPVVVSGVGTVESVSNVVVKPQIAGALLTVHFREGQIVNQGDLLFTIDPRPFQAEMAQAEANLAKNIAQAKTAKELATRYENLVKKDYVTKEQYDQVRTNAEALAATVDADRAAVDNARLMLAYASIRSPISGRTGQILVHAGNVLKANETELVQIHQIDPMYISFSVPEEHLADIRSHSAQEKLSVTAIDKSGKNAVNGTLVFINNQVNQDTGTIQLKATFDNKKGVLWPGEFTNVTLTLTTREGATVVPAQAVESGQNGPYVYIVKPDKTAEVRLVTVGASVGEETIIEKGVRPGETVVTDGQLRLLPGAKVEFKNAENPS